jgi:hypothetical protein
VSQNLTHSPADVIRRLLIALGVGTDPDALGEWPIFASGEPAVPDNCITLYDTAGAGGGRMMVNGELVSFDGIQARVRASTHPVGWKKADEIQTAFAMDVYNETVVLESVTYRVFSISRIGDVLALGKESPTSKRSLFTVNATVAMEQC